MSDREPFDPRVQERTERVIGQTLVEVSGRALARELGVESANQLYVLP
jgi:hypothetical protein